MRRFLLLTFAALCALALLNGSMAESANSDWYASVLDDRDIVEEYPYYAILDINGDDVPVLIVSSTEDSLIGFEDRGRVYTCFEGKPTLVMEAGGGGGDTFFSCWDEHTLTHHSRLSGEAHMEVYRVMDGALELVTQTDVYEPGHYDQYANDETVYLRDGAEITAKQYNALRARYANDSDIVTYEGESEYAPDDDDGRKDEASVSIEWAQKRLRALGYTAAPVDGVYGSRLKSAVKRFQREVGLKADGIIGDNTIRALKKKSAPYCSDYIELRKGDSGDRVKELQEKLRELGFLKGGIDGKYGRKTVDAVAWYKSHFDLDGSGRSVDAETVRMIMETDPEDVEWSDEEEYDEEDEDEEDYEDENDHGEEGYDDDYRDDDHDDGDYHDDDADDDDDGGDYDGGGDYDNGGDYDDGGDYDGGGDYDDGGYDDDGAVG